MPRNLLRECHPDARPHFFVGIMNERAAGCAESIATYERMLRGPLTPQTRTQFERTQRHLHRIRARAQRLVRRTLAAMPYDQADRLVRTLRRPVQ